MTWIKRFAGTAVGAGCCDYAVLSIMHRHLPSPLPSVVFGVAAACASELVLLLRRRRPE